MKIFTKLTLLSTLLFSSLSSAALIQADWKEDGDSLAVLDTNTNKKWLDLTQTVGKSIFDVRNLLSTDYDGFRIATKLEVEEMMFAHYGTTAQTVRDWNGYMRYSGNAFGVMDDFGYKIVQGTGRLFYYTMGYYEKEDGTYGEAGQRYDTYNGGSTYVRMPFEHITYGSYSEDISNVNYGVFLVEDSDYVADSGNSGNASSVPLPASILLFLPLFIFRRKLNK